MPRQPLSARLSGARSKMESVVPSSPSLAKSSCQGAQAKPQSQMPKDAPSGKENKAHEIRTRTHAFESPQASVDDATTPLPLTRPFPDATPDALAKRLQCPEMLVLHLPKETAVEQAPLEPVTEADSVQHAASEQVRGLGELPQFDLVDGKMPVKNTFINFDVPSSSPCAASRTKPLSGDSAPKNWAPGPFGIEESAECDFFDGPLPVKNTFISFPVPSSSPCTASRAKTKPLSSDSAPKNWAPGPFGIEDSGRHDLSKFVASFWTSQCQGIRGASLDVALMQASQDPALQDDSGTPTFKDTATHPAFMGDSPCPVFMGASPEPYCMGASPDGLPLWDEQTAVENLVVIHLQQSLDQAVSAPKQDTTRYELQLSLWIASDPPSSGSTASTACEPQPPVRLGVHHFPVSHALPSVSPEAPTAPVVAAARVGDGSGISRDVLLSKCLIFQN